MEGYIESFFTREKEHPDRELIRLIDGAKKTLDIAIYTITKKEIVEAIINAKNRGISIRIIADKQEVNSKYEKVVIDFFKSINIPIKVNKHRGLMHLKVIIVDETIATSGSYNYTEAASTENDDVLLVIRDTEIVKEFIKAFNNMWNDNKKFKDYE